MKMSIEVKRRQWIPWNWVTGVWEPHDFGARTEFGFSAKVTILLTSEPLFLPQCVLKASLIETPFLWRPTSSKASVYSANKCS